jgi:hypothetical protein
MSSENLNLNTIKDEGRQMKVERLEDARFVYDETNGYYHVIIKSIPQAEEKNVYDIHGHYIHNAVFIYNFISKVQLNTINSEGNTVLAVNKVEEICNYLHDNYFKKSSHWKEKSLKIIGEWIKSLLGGKVLDVTVEDEKYEIIDKPIVGPSIIGSTHIYVVKKLTRTDIMKRANDKKKYMNILDNYMY